MLVRSPKDRSRSPHRLNGTTNSSTTKHSSNQNDTSSSSTDANINKVKKENDSQLRLKNLKSFLQTLITDSSALGSTYDEQVKALENACMKEFHDLSHDRIRRMIRNVFKGRKSHSTNSFLHQDLSNTLPTTTTDRFNSNENNPKKNRSNSTSNNSTANSDLVTPAASTLSALDADFLRHAFSQQFRPSLDLSAYFSAASTPNGAGSQSSLFRPNFSPSNFLQSLTAPPPPPLSTSLVSSHSHTNGSYQRTTESSSTTTTTTNVNKLSKQMKLSTNETSSLKVLVNAYREAASYLNRSADELEQLI